MVLRKYDNYDDADDDDTINNYDDDVSEYNNDEFYSGKDVNLPL